MKNNTIKKCNIEGVIELITKSGSTPYIKVATGHPEYSGPIAGYVDSIGMITLSVNGSALGSWDMNADRIAMSASFGGVPMHLYIPMDAVAMVFAKEDPSLSQGFPVEEKWLDEKGLAAKRAEVHVAETLVDNIEACYSRNISPQEIFDELMKKHVNGGLKGYALGLTLEGMLSSIEDDNHMYKVALEMSFATCIMKAEDHGLDIATMFSEVLASYHDMVKDSGHSPLELVSEDIVVEQEIRPVRQEFKPRIVH